MSARIFAADLSSSMMTCWHLPSGGEQVRPGIQAVGERCRRGAGVPVRRERYQAACRSRPASPCSLHVRRDRSGSRCNPRYIRAARRVVGRDRVAPAVPRHHGQRSSAGVCARHSGLAAVAATPARAVAPKASPGSLIKRSGPRSGIVGEGCATCAPGEASTSDVRVAGRHDGLLLLHASRPPPCAVAAPEPPARRRCRPVWRSVAPAFVATRMPLDQ